MKLPITPETEADLKALQDILSAKRKQPASRADVIAWALKAMREKHDPIKKAERSISSGKTKPKNSAKDSGRYIPAATQHRVRVRDQNRCTYRGPEARAVPPRAFSMFITSSTWPTVVPIRSIIYGSVLCPPCTHSREVRRRKIEGTEADCLNQTSV